MSLTSPRVVGRLSEAMRMVVGCVVGDGAAVTAADVAGSGVVGEVAGVPHPARSASASTPVSRPNNLGMGPPCSMFPGRSPIQPSSGEALVGPQAHGHGTCGS